MIEVKNGHLSPGVREAVLFPFDDASVPFSVGLRLQLVRGKAPGKKNPIVLGRGEPGQPDDQSVRYYGTVVQIGEELRMWYQARGGLDQDRARRVCYAVSRDGVTWEKPKLGLVEYNGSRENNVVDLLGGRCVIAANPVLYDPDDPDPRRRFKTAMETGVYGNRLAVAYSADGLRWSEPPGNPVGAAMEQAGLIKFGGCYYVNGQDEFGSHGSQWGQARKLVTYASYDFEHWTRASSLGFRRDNVPPRQVATEWNNAEEVHLGAGLWDRGNVIVGVYGMWHGTPTGDRAYITMDLGLLVSSDALHFREPIPDFRLLPSYEEPGVAAGTGPALMQGQGMWNVGEKTLFWYESWRDGEVRMASWERDRLGYYEAFNAEAGPHLISCPLRLGSPARVYANAGSLSEHSRLTVSLCDEQFRPLPGYSGDACIPLRAAGLRQPVTWKAHDSPRDIGEPVRLRVDFGGPSAERARLYALYVTEGV